MKKVKISELTEYQSLTGLWTIGTNPQNQSVKVSLEFIENQFKKMPKIQNGTWWVWDDTTQAYVNSTVSATGKSPYISSNNTWVVYNDATGAYVDTGLSVTGYTLSKWDDSTPTKAGYATVFAGNIYRAKVDTSRPPIACYVLSGNTSAYLMTEQGYIPLGDWDTYGNKDDWDRLTGYEDDYYQSPVYADGSWYRKYTDHRLECGGSIAAGTSVTINFPHQFENANYYFTSSANILTITKAKGSITITLAAAQQIDWMAVGIW